jgi:hypothetical protein
VNMGMDAWNRSRCGQKSRITSRRNPVGNGREICHRNINIYRNIIGMVVVYSLARSISKAFATASYRSLQSASASKFSSQASLAR